MLIARIICRLRGHRWAAMRISRVGNPDPDPTTCMYCQRCGKQVPGDSVRDGAYEYHVRAVKAGDVSEIKSTDNA